MSTIRKQKKLVRSEPLIRAQEAYERRRNQSGDTKLAIWMDRELRDRLQVHADTHFHGKLAPAIRDLLHKSLEGETK